MEDACVNFDLLDTRAVELFEGCDDAGFLAGAGGTIDEEMGEVAALSLQIRQFISSDYYRDLSRVAGSD